MNKKHIGSNLDDFLKEEKIYEQAQAAAIESLWNMLIAESEEKIRVLANGRGLNWNKMTEDEREKIVDDLLHENWFKLRAV
jgi:intracellular sulfur oxidation DsrE/DsrF family protein